MNTRQWVDGVSREDIPVVAGIHLLAIPLGAATGLNWLDPGLGALFVGFAAVVAAVLVLIRKPMPGAPPLTLIVVFLTIVTPAAAGIATHGFVRAVTVEDKPVDVKWSLDHLLPGQVATTKVRVDGGYGRLSVPVSYSDPDGDGGSCPGNRVSLLLNDQPPNQGSNEFRNGKSAEFEVPKGEIVNLSMKLIAERNCSITIETQKVILHR